MEDNKKYIKSYIDLTLCEIGYYVWSDAWQFKKNSNGLVEFKINNLNHGILVGLSPKKSISSKMIEIIIKPFNSINNINKQYSIMIRNYKKEILIEKDFNLLLDEASFWISISEKKINFGFGMFHKNHTLTFIPHNDDILKELKFVGFSKFEKLQQLPVYVKNIRIKGSVCDIFAVRNHILEIKNNIENTIIDEQSLYDFFGNDVSKIIEVQKNHFLVIMQGMY